MEPCQHLPVQGGLVGKKATEPVELVVRIGEGVERDAGPGIGRKSLVLTGDGVDQEQSVVIAATVRIEEQISIAGQEGAVADICAKEHFRVVSHGEAKVRAGADLEHLVPIVARLLKMGAPLADKMCIV